MATKSVAIIDIGSSAMTVLIGERGVNGTFKVKGRGVADYAGFENGEFIEPENVKMAVALALANAEVSCGEKVTDIFVGVPGEFTSVVCKEVAINFNKNKKITTNEINRLFYVGNVFKNHPTHTLINNSPIYFTMDDGRRVIDPRGAVSGRLSGLISYVLAENNFLDFFEDVLGACGVKRSTYISACLAQCLHLFEPQVRDRYCLVVDCGYITTNVMLCRGDGLLYLSNFSMGGGYITADLASCLKINFSQAEMLKHKAVISWKPDKNDTYEVQNKEFITPYSAKDTNDIVCDRLDMIIKYINKAFDNCIYDFPEYIPLYLTGGGLSYIPGVKDYLSKRLGRKVELATPNLPHMARPDYSSEIGLLDIAIEIKNGGAAGIVALN